MNKRVHQDLGLFGYYPIIDRKNQVYMQVAQQYIEALNSSADGVGDAVQVCAALPPPLPTPRIVNMWQTASPRHAHMRVFPPHGLSHATPTVFLQLRLEVTPAVYRALGVPPPPPSSTEDTARARATRPPVHMGAVPVASSSFWARLQDMLP